MALLIKKSVAILMSTYNGEKYLHEQISSILNQSHKDLRLYIRDDGSNDDTLRIISEYQRKDARIILIEDNIVHRGVKGSFNYLMEVVDADYYMFCDQDDVWSAVKVEESLRAIDPINEEKPVVACSDLSLVNHKLDIINESMWKTHRLTNLVDNRNGIKIASMFPGCTMIFNNQAKKLALMDNFDFPLHDIQLSLVTIKNGGDILPIHKPLIKYRQHSNNVVGLYFGQNFMLNKVVNFKKTIGNTLKYFRLVHQYLNVSLAEFMMLKIKHVLNIL